MSKRERIIISIADLPDVSRVDVTGDVPLSGGEHMIQLLVYFDNERSPVPKALGVSVNDGVGTKEKLG